MPLLLPDLGVLATPLYPAEATGFTMVLCFADTLDFWGALSLRLESPDDEVPPALAMLPRPRKPAAIRGITVGAPADLTASEAPFLAASRTESRISSMSGAEEDEEDELSPPTPSPPPMGV